MMMICYLVYEYEKDPQVPMIKIHCKVTNMVNFALGICPKMEMAKLSEVRCSDRVPQLR